MVVGETHHFFGTPHLEGFGIHPHGGCHLAGFLVAIQQRFPPRQKLRTMGFVFKVIV